MYVSVIIFGFKSFVWMASHTLIDRCFSSIPPFRKKNNSGGAVLGVTLGQCERIPLDDELSSSNHAAELKVKMPGASCAQYCILKHIPHTCSHTLGVVVLSIIVVSMCVRLGGWLRVGMISFVEANTKRSVV